MKTILLITVMSLFGLANGQGNLGALKGSVEDLETGEEIFGVNVVIYKNDSTFYKGVFSDYEGNYIFPHVTEGLYDIEFSLIGYKNQKFTGVVIKANEITTLICQLKSEYKLLECVEVHTTATKRKKQLGRSVNYRIGTNAVKGVGFTKRRGKKSESQRKLIGGGNAKVSKTNRNKYSEFTENAFIKVNNEALSTFSIDVDNASYTIMRKHISSGTKPPAEAIRIEEMINYFKYKYPSPTDDKPFAVHTEIADAPWSKNKIVKIGLKGKTFEDKKAPKNNLVFLLDVSGSMNSANKLGYVKKSMKMLVKSLSENDKVSIVTYAGYTATPLKPTPCNQIDKIYAAIDGLASGGSTNGEGGIRQAYYMAEKNFMKNGNNRIILCTDGDFNVGVATNDALGKLIEKKRASGVYLTVCGFGIGNLQDQYMETLADKGNGNYYYIDNLLEAKKVFQEDFTATIHTIAKDVKIQVEFNPKHVKSYRLIGYDNRMLKKEDFLDDTKDAGELGAGHTVTAIYEVVLKTTEEEFNNGLRYQSSELKDGLENELLTVKLRYKKPDENKSQGFEVPILYDQKSELSEDFKFALSVVEFGMILRKSKYKGNANLDHAIEMAKAGKGNDEYGYRSEFIRLMEMYEINLAAK